jgi:hypothetical protein
MKHALKFGFFLGIAVLSLISIIRTALNQNLYAYDWYILGVSIIGMIILLLVGRNKK